MLFGEVHCASIQDRAGAPDGIEQACEGLPTLSLFFANAGYSGDAVMGALSDLETAPTIELVRRSNNATGFIVVARRWVVERTISWLGRGRRLAKDWETSIASPNAWLYIASIRRSARHIARKMALEFCVRLLRFDTPNYSFYLTYRFSGDSAVTVGKSDLVVRIEGERAEARQLAETFNESTGLSWLWALIFGPMYFWVHGFVARGFVLLGISIVTFGVGALLAPFIVYPAWRKRAEKKASDMVAISKARDGRG